MSELILGPIIGGLTDTSAHLWGRADSSGILLAWLGRKSDLSDALPTASSLPLRPEDGFAGVAPVNGLDPETTYYYDLRLDKKTPPIHDGYPKFTTFPRTGKIRDFSFTFGSCFRPENRESGGKIFSSLDTLRASRESVSALKLRFSLFIGDQIYADDWNYNGLGTFNPGIYKGASSLEDYRNVYQYTWSHAPFKALLKNLPAFMTLDDHEVDDDWRWTNSQRTQATFSAYTRLMRRLQGRPNEERFLSLARVQNALKAYWEHQGMHAPRMLLPFEREVDGRYSMNHDQPGSLAYTFTYGAAAFFVLDTRTMRVKNRHEVHMLGEGQWQILQDWLLQVRDTFPVKFLVSSSSILYSMFGDFLGDRWSGFRSERDRLLRFIGDNQIENLYILAGDLHSSHFMTAECGPISTPVLIHEFCSTPFEQVCNKYAGLLYTSIRTGSVHKPKRFFVITKPNFGLVQVRFQEGRPIVDFSLYGTDGELLASK